MNDLQPFPITGRVNRRDLVDKLGDGVLARENFIVVGIGKDKYNKKHPGSDRLVGTPVDGTFTRLFRYYNGETAKWFGYSISSLAGKLQYIDNYGAVTLIENLATTGEGSAPTFLEMKVSESNTGIFMDGFNGIWSYDGNEGNGWTAQPQVSFNPISGTIHLDRLFCFPDDSEDLYFSVNLNPFDFTNSTDAGIIQIGAKRGSIIQNIGIMNETLYIFKQDSIWVMEGRTPSEFTIREVVPDLGLAARYGIARIKNGPFVFLGSDYEFYSFDGNQVKKLSYNIAIGGDLTKDLVPVINKYRMLQVDACFHQDLFRCSFVENGETVANVEYIFNTTNETDGLTRGNGVTCYLVQDKEPDKGELITGHTNGRVMYQYRGLNWDNDAGDTSTMPVKLQSGFVRPADVNNVRMLKVFGDFKVQGAQALTMYNYVDNRNAVSDRRSFQLPITGEYKALTNFIRTASQLAVTSRGIPNWYGAKGQTHSLEIDTDLHDIDLAVGNLQAEFLVKNRKRSVAVGV